MFARVPDAAECDLCASVGSRMIRAAAPVTPSRGRVRGNGSRSPAQSGGRVAWVGGGRPPHVEYREWATVVVEGRSADDYEAECLVEAARRGVLLVDVDGQVAVA